MLSLMCHCMRMLVHLQRHRAFTGLLMYQCPQAVTLWRHYVEEIRKFTLKFLT